MNDHETLDPSPEATGVPSEAPPELDGSADLSEGAPEPEPEPQPTPPSPADERIRELSERNRQLEQTMGLLQQQMLQQQRPAPPADPFADPSLPPEWQQSLRVTHQHLAPQFQAQVEQALAPIRQQALQAQVLAESAALAAKEADYRRYEQQAVALRLQTGLPLEAIYTYLIGEQARAGRTQGQQQARASARAKGKVGATTAAPIGAGAGHRGAPRTPESIRQMTDAEILALSDQLTKASGG